jgi:drug/metabolite transporter (DMT)-like permease
MNKAKSIIATPLSVVLFLIGWALTPVFVRYMSGAYDPYTQAFIRYVSAAAALIVYASLCHRKDLVKAFGSWRTLLPMSLLMLCMQTAWMVAIYHTTATMAQLVTTLQAPLVILLSFVVFHEERQVICSPGYLIGSFLCLVGVLAVFMRDEGGGLRFHVDFAMLLLMFVSMAWAVYAVWGRHTAKGLHPVAMFTVLSVYVSIGFVFIMCFFGDPTTLWSAGLRMNGIAFVSGVVCIAAAHCGFHYAQVRLGSAYCTSLQLGTPFITHLLAYALWPDEALLWIQWAGGIMLVGGGLLVVRARWRTVSGLN